MFLSVGECFIIFFYVYINFIYYFIEPYKEEDKKKKKGPGLTPNRDKMENLCLLCFFSSFKLEV